MAPSLFLRVLIVCIKVGPWSSCKVVGQFNHSGLHA